MRRNTHQSKNEFQVYSLHHFQQTSSQLIYLTCKSTALQLCTTWYCIRAENCNSVKTSCTNEHVYTMSTQQSSQLSSQAARSTAAKSSIRERSDGFATAECLYSITGIGICDIRTTLAMLSDKCRQMINKFFTPIQTHKPSTLLGP